MWYSGLILYLGHWNSILECVVQVLTISLWIQLLLMSLKRQQMIAQVLGSLSTTWENEMD